MGNTSLATGIFSIRHFFKQMMKLFDLLENPMNLMINLTPVYKVSTNIKELTLARSIFLTVDILMVKTQE